MCFLVRVCDVGSFGLTLPLRLMLLAPRVLKVVLGGLSLLCVSSILTSWAYLVRFPELPLPLLLWGFVSSLWGVSPLAW